MSGFRMRALRARVLVEAAPVDGLRAEVEAALDLDAVDVKAVAGLDVGALLTLELGVLDGVEIKCRLDFGAKAIDWRGLYKNPGA